MLVTKLGKLPRQEAVGVGESGLPPFQRRRVDYLELLQPHSPHVSREDCSAVVATQQLCHQRVQRLLVSQILPVVEVYKVLWDTQVVLQRHQKLGAGGVNHKHLQNW